MANIKEIINSLHPLERKIVPLLSKYTSFSDFVNESKLQEVEIMRALQWLQNKDVLNLKTDVKEVVLLDQNGIAYAEQGLPEIKFLRALNEISQGEQKLVFVDEIQESSGIAKEEINICLGTLKRKAAINVGKKDDKLTAIMSEQGKKLLEKPGLEGEFLKKQFPVELKNLTDEEKLAFDNLKKRKKIVKIELQKIKTIELTDVGKKLITEKIDFDVEDRLTPEMLKNNSWKGKTFRSYDVEINVPKITFGKKQHYRRFLDNVRRKFLSLGFEEMAGPIVETDFWDMDALFMPQFHSARDIHDAYYIKEPLFGKINKKTIEKVKNTHENGSNTGSKGWNYKFDEKRTLRQLLRTQGTACSARKLASEDLKVPGKYFGITRCFRSDVIDATHNVDFNQTEGIVLGENLNLRHLFGLLKMFAKEFADTEEIRIVPSYFPFTEPSCELFAKHPKLGWIELGGAGIFRPEVVNPLIDINPNKDLKKKNISVLAWGLGIDRIAMFKLGIKDIRKLFSHDLEFLKNIKIE